MKHKSLISKLKKAGATIVEHKEGHEFSVTMNNRELHWYKQNDNVVCLRSRHIDDLDDLYTDYYAGFFPRTIKSAIETLSWNLSERHKKEMAMDNIIAEILEQ